MTAKTALKIAAVFSAMGFAYHEFFGDADKAETIIVIVAVFYAALLVCEHIDERVKK